MTNRLTFMRTEEEINEYIKALQDQRARMERSLIGRARDGGMVDTVRYCAEQIEEDTRRITLLEWVMGGELG